MTPFDPSALVGRRLDGLFAAWWVADDQRPQGPIDVWLVGEQGVPTHLTTAADWRLVVVEEHPYGDYDMDGLGRVEVLPTAEGTPFARHVGQAVTAVHQDWDPDHGLTGLAIEFPDGTVHADSWDGDLRLRD
ncbi:hypothetical protein KIK06_25505 [Nocardiopsis sp. EMB25]|uniref:hypothetical protein n=1 Tax=Nocardiopsis TaxID=2013 RepID=UPI0003499F87|nr:MULTISPECIES: hypothetical protein [Nocardiopsis]MCY9787242.1 hypothetical protein [Nocardiopsis sp. EMB25]